MNKIITRSRIFVTFFLTHRGGQVEVQGRSNRDPVKVHLRSDRGPGEIWLKSLTFNFVHFLTIFYHHWKYGQHSPSGHYAIQAHRECIWEGGRVLTWGKLSLFSKMDEFCQLCTVIFTYFVSIYLLKNYNFIVNFVWVSYVEITFLWKNNFLSYLSE